MAFSFRRKKKTGVEPTVIDTSKVDGSERVSDVVSGGQQVYGTAWEGNAEAVKGRETVPLAGDDDGSLIHPPGTSSLESKANENEGVPMDPGALGRKGSPVNVYENYYMKVVGARKDNGHVRVMFLTPPESKGRFAEMPKEAYRLIEDSSVVNGENVAGLRADFGLGEKDRITGYSPELFDVAKKIPEYKGKIKEWELEVKEEEQTEGQ